MAFLVVTPPQARPFSVELNTKLIDVGRDGNCVVPIEDPLLSKRHCLIERQAQEWVLTDGGSRNGTFIGKDRVAQNARVKLRDGDTIGAGLSNLVFYAGARPPNSPPLRRTGLSTDEFLSVNDVADGSSTSSVPAELVRLLLSIADEVLPESQPERLLEQACRIAKDSLGALRTAVFLSKGERAAASFPPDAPALELNHHAYEMVAAKRGVVRVAGGKNTASLMLIPLWTHGEVSGVLAVEGTKEDAAGMGIVFAGLLGAAYDNACAYAAMFGERQRLMSRASQTDEECTALIGDSEATVKLRQALAQAAGAKRVVFFHGPRGTAMEALARALHALSSRSEAGFFVVDEAFSALDAARGGVLFVPDASRVPEDFPARVAAHAAMPALIVVAADKALPSTWTPEFVLTVAPLAERKKDLPLIADALIRRAGGKHEKKVQLSPQALQALSARDFAGNDLELASLIERAVLLTRDGEQIDADAFDTEAVAEGTSLAEAMDTYERVYILKLLEAQHGHRIRTAKQLGISRQALTRKLKRYGLTQAGDDEE